MLVQEAGSPVGAAPVLGNNASPALKKRVPAGLSDSGYDAGKGPTENTNEEKDMYADSD